MDYIVNHDLHLHSSLSYCSLNPEQSKESILNYAKENGFNKICVTDHFWDERVARLPSVSGSYDKQTSRYISTILPLPQDDDVKFLFGGECEMDYNMQIGITDEFLQKLDFMVVPITHLHLNDFTIDNKIIVAEQYRLADTDYNIKYISELWVNRFDTLLNADLPFKKIGAAHLSWIPFRSLSSVTEMFRLISDKTLAELFSRAAGKGMGIELNISRAERNGTEGELLRLFKAAKDCGCKFYFGSDAHHPANFVGKKSDFQETVNWLSLKESDKFLIAK